MCFQVTKALFKNEAKKNLQGYKPTVTLIQDGDAGNKKTPIPVFPV